jgi:hypothetical protein
MYNFTVSAFPQLISKLFSLQEEYLNQYGSVLASTVCDSDSVGFLVIIFSRAA